MTLIAFSSGTAATLTWLAFVGIVVAAVILYWPRSFSGPLTGHERALARGRFGRRSLALVLATPLAAVVGFGLLLPPMVQLDVSGGQVGERCVLPSGLLSAISTSESTAPWVDSVRCRARSGRRDVLAQAIVEAAADGFRVPAGCRPREPHPEDLSIELSLVEVAARAFFVTGVVLDPGPRITDPDPWDIMERTLQARGVPTCSSRAPDAAGEGKILHIGPTIVIKADQGVEVGVAVHGTVCGTIAAELLAADRTVLRTCELQPPKDCAGESRHFFAMRASCGDWTGGSILRAGALESRVYFDRAVRLRFDDASLGEVFAAALRSTSFIHDLRRRGLGIPQICKDCGDAGVVEIDGEDVVIRAPTASGRGPTGGFTSLPVELRHGPFSWAGIEHIPEIHCLGDQIVIEGAAAIVRAPLELRDPTALYALMSTIAWAARAVSSSSCAEIRQPVEVDGGAHPLLTAVEVDAAVAAMRRERETLGLVCLGLSLVGLALGLRRSIR